MIQLAEVFQDNMTLQRGKKIRVWGKTDKPQSVCVYVNGEMVLEEKIEGDFEIFLPAQEAVWSAKLEMVGSAGDCVVLQNVDIGEVWIAGGQSNMEFMLEYDAEAEQMITEANDDHYRFYDVGEFCFEGEKEENLKWLAAHWDKWVTYNPQDAPFISAAATYFALVLRKKLNVPVAVVGCNWGGTSASSWLPEEDLRKDAKLSVYLEEYEKEKAKIKDMDAYIRKDYSYRQKKGTEASQKQSDQLMKTEAQAPYSALEIAAFSILNAAHVMGPHHDRRPGALYENMLKKIIGFTTRGVIWYQGCSDENHADLYARLFTRVICRWRKDWNDQLPFLFVQLAPFEEWRECRGKNYPKIRAQQKKVAENEKDCYMVSIMDAGSRFDIHPKQKRKPGERLAAAALHQIYGKNEIACEHPEIIDVKRHGAALIVTINNAESGLVLEETGEKNRSFAGLEYLFRIYADGKKAKISAFICGNQVIIESPAVEKARDVSISFANMPYCYVNLKSREGLPVLPMMKTVVK